MNLQLKKTLMTFVLLSLTLGCGQQSDEPKEADLSRLHALSDDRTKKVILVVADSLLSRAIEEGIAQNKLPTFEYLVKHGQYFNDFVSSYPTMSVTIDSALLTGADPSRHRVPGLVWYSDSERRIVTYGTGSFETVKNGVQPVFLNALLHLNGRHLSDRTPTIYEDAAKLGLSSGSINGLIFRGTTPHTLSVPVWLQEALAVPGEAEVTGPDFLALGTFSNPLEGKVDLPDGAISRLGMNNRYSIEVATFLIKNGSLPDFLFVYLPDLDSRLHNKGPSDLKGVQDVDRQIQALLQAFGSPEEAARKAVILVMGDSGVSQVHPRTVDSTVPLHELLGQYRVLQFGGSVTEETDLALAVNESMAYVYKLKSEPSLRDVADVLIADERIDFASWKEDGWIHVVQGGTGETLQYRKGGSVLDPYKQAWTVEGNPDVFDLRVAGNSLSYGDYPDGLQRLYAALHSHEGEFLVVNAKPGYELANESSPTHPGGGAHGSIYKTDTLFPVIVYGTDEKPDNRRITDIKPFIMRLLASFSS
ncbi:alkaline phosphatase family protein [Paenibacillus antri]|uniref:Alkaline phosphatase family protein n=1 Tax=Paenibacillus antri TaxID=2582848 RepID=A0A5R9FXH7_9BACL|nr:alkaline phosphatase family protein [Paenibacillus antri]TLS48717.1 alkaline phosphatase family protein [Paenibacillus antri]